MVIRGLPTKTWLLQAIPKNAQNLRYFWVVSAVIRRLPVKPWFPQAIPRNAQNLIPSRKNICSRLRLEHNFINRSDANATP